MMNWIYVILHIVCDAAWTVAAVFFCIACRDVSAMMKDDGTDEAGEEWKRAGDDP